MTSLFIPAFLLGLATSVHCISMCGPMWAAMQVVAKKLVELDPTAPHWAIAWAYATRRAESIEQAKVILTDALDRHRTEPLIHYNLACYDCQMGKIPSAKQFIATALRLAPGMRPMALSDEDLKPLWASL